MSAFRIVSIPPSDVATVRATRRDAWGNNDLSTTRADGNPCRICMRDAAEGDELILFSYSPFEGAAPHRTVGPIFVHAHECPPFEWRGELPEQLLRRLLSVHALRGGVEMVHADVIPGVELAALAEKLLADPRVDALHVHFARPGCYACRIVRS